MDFCSRKMENWPTIKEEAPMLALIRSLSAPLFSLALLILASGLFNTFVSIRLELEGYSPETIGIVTSALYLGILVGSLRIDQVIAKQGHARSFVLFAVLITIIILMQAVWVNPWFWSFLRFIGGLCTAGIFIVIESWLLIQSPSNMRGKVLSLYLAVFYGALSLGQFLINLSDPQGIYPFYITALLSSLSILPVMLMKAPHPKRISAPVQLNLPQLFRVSPLGFMGGVISGMLLAVIYGLAPIYARENGMSISEVGTFMAILIFGGLSLQLPIGHWADKGNRRRVLNTASLLTALFGVAIAQIDQLSPLFLLPLAWCFGGFSFTLYPLSMAYTCEKVQEDQIIAATGGFVLSYGIGAIAGPLMAPIAMSFLGSAGLFYFLSAIAFILALIGFKQPKTFS